MLRSAILFPLFVLSAISFNDYSSNPTRLGGTVAIGNNICMLATEVTLKDWLNFIVNNPSDPSLYPDSSIVSDAWTKLLLEDIRKMELKHLKKLSGHYGQLSLLLKRDATLD